MRVYYGSRHDAHFTLKNNIVCFDQMQQIQLQSAPDIPMKKTLSGHETPHNILYCRFLLPTTVFDFLLAPAMASNQPLSPRFTDGEGINLFQEKITSQSDVIGWNYMKMSPSKMQQRHLKSRNDTSYSRTGFQPLTFVYHRLLYQ